MIYPNYNQVKELLKSDTYKRIPITRELYSDQITPIAVLEKLKNVSRHCFMLESAEASKKWGRYTFLGYDPVLELTCQNGRLHLKSSTTITSQTPHPAGAIRKILAENKAPRLEGLPPFTGGLAGYFSYDYIKYSEPCLNLDAKDEDSFKDVDLMLFDKIIAFDNLRQKIILIVNMQTEQPAENYNKAVMELETLASLLINGEPAETRPLKLHSEFRELFDKDTYCQMVERGKYYIKEGDVFQVVLSNRLDADASGSLLDVYRVMRTTNPSPYMFYFSSNDVEIAGASPETLVKLEKGTLHTFPLAGTRPRGETPAEDERLMRELLEDEKEKAEHNMLVDLGRNDLGRISRIGTVEVEKHMSIEKFSHVMHLGSTIRGEIRDDKDAVDAVDAILPAGTLSGAPKIRACQIINSLENNKRGIYGGAIGYIDLTGNLDTCIGIRLAFMKNGKIFIRSGAGIVADSIPENEYQESLQKAQAVVEAVKTAEGGLNL